MGARGEGFTDREITGGHCTVFKDSLPQLVSILGDSMSNNRFDAADLEVVKQAVAGEHEGSNNDLMYTTLENAHFNSFRDHMLGQPIKGEADQIGNLTVDDIASFKAANYFGNNLVVVGTGNINHDQFVDLVNNAFGTISSTATGE